MNDLTVPSALHDGAQSSVCSDTVAGWLWYCDTHDSHGNADSEAEARLVAMTHRDYHGEDGEDEGCDIVVWMRTEHERA